MIFPKRFVLTLGFTTVDQCDASKEMKPKVYFKPRVYVTVGITVLRFWPFVASKSSSNPNVYVSQTCEPYRVCHPLGPRVVASKVSLFVGVTVGAYHDRDPKVYVIVHLRHRSSTSGLLAK